MKLARERFFPSSTPSTPRTSNNHNRSNSSDSEGRLRRVQDSVILSTLQNTGMNRPPTQMGYPAFMKKLAMGANALTAGGIIRPGTAEPRISEERAINVRFENRNIPVVAPTPTKYRQILPPFAPTDGSELLDVSGETHSSKSPDNFIEERQEETFKIPFPKNSNVQQELSQYHPKSLQHRNEPSSMPNDYGDQDGSDVPPQRNKKRMREVDEIEDPNFIERNTKRFKTHEADKMSFQESRSPRPDHASSTGSSATGSPHGRPNVSVVNTPPAQRLQLQRQENLDVNPSNRAHVGLPSRRRSEPVGLDKLLGPGSNDLLDQYADRYEALLKKWSQCSVEEWKAGAGEISARFTMMLDFAKDHLDKKLKTYSGLHAVLDSHFEILRERSETMVLAREKVVKEGANVLM